MLGAYNIDSDDDEEEEEAPTNVPKSASTHIKELEKLKEKTGELLDSSWKEQRNRHLLMKMLELEEPIVTAKMVDFLLQDGVCDILLSLITQIGTKQPRPSPSDAKSEALKLSYRAVMLLTADEPTEALMAFLSKRAGVLARGIFEIYQDDSAASFYHFYRLLECLLRCFPGDVYESICSDGQMDVRMRRMMRYIGYAPVGESLAMLIALTPVSRTSQLYQLSSKNRWLFFEQLSQKNFMLSLVEIIVYPEEFCYVNGYINAEQHSSCATFVLQELVEKLSVEETGELLLQPFGYTTKLLEHLIDTALTGTVISIRRSSTKLLCFLLRRVADSNILYMVSAGAGVAPAPAYVPNRLFPLRDRIINQIFLRIKCVMIALLNSDDTDGVKDEGNFDSETSGSAVKYSSYTVSKPFTVLKSVFFELITLMVESDDTVSELIPVDLWLLLIKWILQYSHNSIFHSIFFRLLYSVLRQEQEEAQINLFQKAKFAVFLSNAFLPSPSNPSGLPDKSTSVDEMNRYVARGLIMNCANATRLQISTQPPTAFLRKFLFNDENWKEFLVKLQVASAIQQDYAFGVKVPEHTNKFKDNSSSSGNGNGNHMDRSDDYSHGGETGSRYARSLGFFDEPSWENINQKNREDIENEYEGIEMKIEKTRKKKLKKKRASGCHQSIPSTWSSGDVEDDTDTGPGSYGIINGEDSINRNGSPDRGGRFAPLKSNDDQDEETLNEISLDHITLEHESGSNGNAHFEHATSALPPPPPSSSSPSSSPSKMGGCPSGEFICVTEICCDEIEIDDKGRKPIGAGAGLNGSHVSSSSNVNNLSLAAASYSEAPASGNL